MASEIDVQGVEREALFDAVDFTGARVLEVGSGDGRLTFAYGQRCTWAVGLEPSAKQLAIAVECCPQALRQRLRFVRASAVALPFGAGSFDIVLFAKSL